MRTGKKYGAGRHFKRKKVGSWFIPTQLFSGRRNEKNAKNMEQNAIKKGGRHELTKQKKCRRMGFFHQPENGQNPIQ
jgi:hypothetical protein